MNPWRDIWSDFDNSRYVRPQPDPRVELHATTRECRGCYLILVEEDEEEIGEAEMV